MLNWIAAPKIGYQRYHAQTTKNHLSVFDLETYARWYVYDTTGDVTLAQGKVTTVVEAKNACEAWLTAH